MYRLYLLIWVLLIPLLTHKTLHDFTGHFHKNKIATFYPEELSHFFQNTKKAPSDIEGKRFRYMGRGNHAFAFESMDGNVVIKFLRFQKFLPHFWERLPWFSQRLQKSIVKRKDRLRFLLQSISLAEKNLKEETGFIHISMLPEESNSVTIYLADRMDRTFPVQLGKYCYIMQKKFPIYGNLLPRTTISKEKADSLFRAYFEVIGARFAKGIMNKDRRGWGKNYGLSQGKAFEIDLGGFAKAVDDNLAWEITQCSRDFRAYVKKNHPSLLSLFEKRLEEALEKSAQEHYQKRVMRKR